MRRSAHKSRGQSEQASGWPPLGDIRFAPESLGLAQVQLYSDRLGRTGSPRLSLFVDCFTLPRTDSESSRFGSLPSEVIGMYGVMTLSQSVMSSPCGALATVWRSRTTRLRPLPGKLSRRPDESFRSPVSNPPCWTPPSGAGSAPARFWGILAPQNKAVSRGRTADECREA